MTQSIDYFPIIWLVLSITYAIFIIVLFFFIKKKNQKLFISIIMNIALVISNIFVIDPIFNLIFLSLLIFNLFYFLLFILKREMFERENLFFEPIEPLINEKEKSQSKEKTNQNTGDSS